jgi:hypothetical protein
MLPQYMRGFLRLSRGRTPHAPVWLSWGIAVGPAVCVWGKRQACVGLRRCRQLSVPPSCGRHWRRGATSRAQAERALLCARASSARAGTRCGPLGSGPHGPHRLVRTWSTNGADGGASARPCAARSPSVRPGERSTRCPSPKSSCGPRRGGAAPVPRSWGPWPLRGAPQRLSGRPNGCGDG